MSSVHRLDPKGSTIYLCARAGCQVCLDRLLTHHEGLIHFAMQRQYGGKLAYDDLLQEGRIGLWHAILRYDPGRGTAFSSFAVVAIRRRIWRTVKLAERGRVCEWRAADLDPAEQVEAAWFWSELRAQVRAAVGQLPERLGQIISEYYGLDGHAPRMLQTVGQLHGISGERVRQLRNNGLLLLRLPALSGSLRELWACHDRAAYRRTQALSRRWLRQRRHHAVRRQRAV